MLGGCKQRVERPKGILLTHVEKQHGHQPRHALAVPHAAVVHGIADKDKESFLLSVLTC